MSTPSGRLNHNPVILSGSGRKSKLYRILFAFVKRNRHRLKSIWKHKDTEPFSAVASQARRQMRDRKSELLEIPGVGERTRQRLLQHFGSIRAMQQADATALGAVLTKSQTEACRGIFSAQAIRPTLADPRGKHFDIGEQTSTLCMFTAHLHFCRIDLRLGVRRFLWLSEAVPDKCPASRVKNGSKPFRENVTVGHSHKAKRTVHQQCDKDQDKKISSA